LTKKTESASSKAEAGPSVLDPPHGTTPAYVYITVARTACKRLASSLRRGGSGKSISPTFILGYAVSCSVFSAIAVEHAIKNLIAIRRTLKVGPQTSLPESFGGRLDTKRMMAFLKLYTRVPHPLIMDIRDMFDYRNTLVHRDIKESVIRMDHPVPAETVGIVIHCLDLDDVKRAGQCLKVAERALTALEEAIVDPDRPRLTPTSES
jgi:hypothetical protein